MTSRACSPASTGTFPSCSWPSLRPGRPCPQHCLPEYLRLGFFRPAPFSQSVTPSMRRTPAVRCKSDRPSPCLFTCSSLAILRRLRRCQAVPLRRHLRRSQRAKRALAMMSLTASEKENVSQYGRKLFTRQGFDSAAPRLTLCSTQYKATVHARQVLRS